MIKLLKRIHSIYFSFWIVFFFFLFWPLYYWGTRRPSRYLALNKIRAVHAFLSTALSGVFFRFKFEKPLDNQTYIYCANHTSNLDIVLFCLLAKGKFHFMGKEELMKNPVLGIFFRTIDVAVSRDSKISAFRAFKKVGENLDRGMSLIIFPEGRIDDLYPPVLHEFKNGPFRLAIEHNIPIVPVSIINLWEIMWDSGFKYGTRPGIGEIYVHEPISTVILATESADVLKEEVFNKINSKLQR
ncbi:1-acyl-sn-glycerol-3-phosphate acyltransferase [Pedobacter polaris]|uniref:1-acyl-sn-glycerol-3-phosphate acyltransferase n=1 Tax=Pedobacter polaris TaxID=2571273 RepID=A0A4U1CQP3_9SPHI|nr:lysophospholipid acyltransferase family protein [Pedobacter polaris]TKC09994.1 1-acyl-sn-glycerol-3-phosphate acyltransferase [Pedobacter polaris]